MLNEKIYIARHIKLDDGTWGAKVDGVPDVGNKLEIRTWNGNSWVSIVREIISKDKHSAITRVAKHYSRPPYRRYPIPYYPVVKK